MKEGKFGMTREDRLEMALRLAGCTQGGYQENCGHRFKKMERQVGDQWLKAAAVSPGPSLAAGPKTPKPLAWL